MKTNKQYKEIYKGGQYRTMYEFSDRNAKGERIVFELTKCENPGGKHALPVLWHKAGCVDRVLQTYWCVSTYVHEENGNCRGWYNPQVKPDTHKIDFRYILEATEENKELLINEIAARAFAE